MLKLKGRCIGHYIQAKLDIPEDNGVDNLEGHI
jgi:hypothetical protein